MDKAITDIALLADKASDLCAIESITADIYTQMKERLFEVMDGCRANLIENGSIESDIQAFRDSSSEYRVMDIKSKVGFNVVIEFSESSTEVTGYPALFMEEPIKPVEDTPA